MKFCQQKQQNQQYNQHFQQNSIFYQYISYQFKTQLTPPSFKYQLTNIIIKLNFLRHQIFLFNFTVYNCICIIEYPRTDQILKGPQDIQLTIGFGSYETVKLARCKQTKEVVALKIIHSKNAKQQVEFQKRLNHPNIIRLIDYYYDKQKNVTYMVLQYADNSTLFQRIKQMQLEKSYIRNIFKEICIAVAFLHKNRIMHRDIKPQNILLTKKYESKLCDFGFASQSYNPRKTLCGTYQYMSPQMILNQPYTHKNDIWSLGILLFQMIQGSAPFRGENPQQVQVLYSMKQHIYFSKKFTKEEISLIKDILRVNPKNRPEIIQILSHPFFDQQNSYGKLSQSSTSFGEQDSLSLTPKIKLLDVKFVKIENEDYNKRFQKSMIKQSPKLLKAQRQQHSHQPNSNKISLIGRR